MTASMCKRISGRMNNANDGRSKRNHEKGFLGLSSRTVMPTCSLSTREVPPGTKKTEHWSSKVQKFMFMYISLAGFKFVSRG